MDSVNAAKLDAERHIHTNIQSTSDFMQFLDIAAKADLKSSPISNLVTRNTPQISYTL